MHIKCVFLIPIEFIYWYLVLNRSVTISCVQISKFFFTLALNVWYFYVVYTFYSSENECKEQSIYLYVAHVILVLEALLAFSTTALILSLCLLLMWILWISNSRRYFNKTRNLRLKDVILNATNLKLTQDHVNYEEDWVICLDEFQADQNIIRLPWDPKHYFHANWIGDWIERK